MTIGRVYPSEFRLQTRGPIWEDEPAYGLMTRLAWAHGASSMISFAGDFKIPYRHVIRGRCNEEIAALASMNPNVLDGATFRVGDDGRVCLNGEVLLSEDWAYQNLRVCPACLCDDANRESRFPHLLPHIRSWWNVDAISVCPFHQTPLIEGDPADPSSRIDVTALDIRFAAGAGCDLSKVSAKVGSVPDVAAESYILGRLGFLPRITCDFFDRFPLWAAIRLMDRFGAVAANGRQSYTYHGGDTTRHGALAAGYSIFTDGEAGLFRFLDGLVASAPVERGKWGPRVVYGRIYDWLSHDTRDPVFDPVRELVRKHALDNVPVAPSDVVMGRLAGERRLFTLWHASREFGMVPTTTRRILKALGHLSEDDDTKDNWQLIFRAEIIKEVSSDLAGRMSYNEARAFLGLARQPMDTLCKAGLVQPFLHLSTGVAEYVFRRRDLEALLTSLSSSAPTVSRRADGLVDIVEAGRRTLTSSVAVAKALQDGRLKCAGLLLSATGLMRVLVDLEEVRGVLAPRAVEGQGITLDVARRRLGLTWNVVGKLIQLGFIEVTKGPTSIHNRRRKFIAEAEVERFEREYVSAAELAKACGTHVRVLVQALRERGIEPSIENWVVGQYFYNRAASEPLNKGFWTTTRNAGKNGF